jgi:polyhydroxyalkanoate synthesis regulator phasin
MQELLVESYCIQEAIKKDNKYILRGLFQKADAKNANGRVYPREILEREVNKLLPLIKDRKLVGELDHPKEAVISYQNASHLITELRFEGNDVIGTLEVLRGLPKADIVIGLLENGVKIGVSSRGLGTVRKEGEFLVVNDDFNLVTEDIVAEPSTTGAFVEPVAISESILRVLYRKEVSKPANLKKELNKIIDEMVKRIQNA